MNHAIWAQFVSELTALGEKTMDQLGGLARELERQIEDQLNDLEGLQFASSARTSKALEMARSDLRERYLESVQRRLENSRPHRRVLLALERFDRASEELCRALPDRTRLSLRQLAEAVGRSPGVAESLAGARARAMQPRRRLHAALQKRNLARLPIESEFCLCLTSGLNMLHYGWDVAVRAFDERFYQPEDEVDPEEVIADARSDLQLLRSRLEVLRRRSAACLTAWGAWLRATPAVLAAGMLRSSRRNPVRGVVPEARALYLDHWMAQFRSSEMGIRLEVTLERGWTACLQLFQDHLGRLDQELNTLLRELDEVSQWLNRCLQESSREAFPAPGADVLAASRRILIFESDLERVKELLPWTSDVLRQLQVRPRKPRWTRIAPRQSLERSYTRVVRAETLELLHDVEEEHRKILCEIDRARDVVTYALGTEQDGEETGVAREALSNALSLLDHHQTHPPSWREGADVTCATLVVGWFRDTRQLLSRDRLGVWTYLARHSAGQALQLAGRATSAAARLAADQMLEWGNRGRDRFLESIGWKRATPRKGSLVQVRPYLPTEYIVDPRDRQLPAIYNRLFRLAPVEDARFLVGRTQELDSLEEARQVFSQGRPVAILVSGQRGTGKTSLLNCALASVFKDMPLVRGEFHGRLHSEQDLDDFFRQLLGIDADTDVVDYLAAHPSLVVLEEVERTFLRQVGHYDALRALENLVASTCRHTLWLLAINEASLTLLNSVMGFSQRFSHRISSLNVSPEAIREAVLVRHNLSGLRLRFPVKVGPTGYLGPLRSRLSGEASSPEEAFFQELAQRSGGVFRTALELWLGLIDSFDAGTIYMRPWLPNSVMSVVNDLDLKDLFTLVAIMQHGSLTGDEHANVFGIGLPDSRSQLDELLGRELLEADPSHPGMRIRPEAMPVVYEALYRRNLL